MASNIGDECFRNSSDNSGQRTDRIAQLGGIRFLVVAEAVGEVNVAAMLVDVRKGVDERVLPAREQRDGEDYSGKETRH